MYFLNHSILMRFFEIIIYHIDEFWIKFLGIKNTFAHKSEPVKWYPSPDIDVKKHKFGPFYASLPVLNLVLIHL